MRYDENDELNNARREAASGRMPDNYSRLMGALDGLPDVASATSMPIPHVPPLGIGGVETFLVRTYRQKDVGDTIFLEHVSASGAIRIVLPPKVAACIASQRDRLTTTVRRKHSKRIAQERKAAGIQPAFMKTKGAAKREKEQQ